MSSGSLDTLFRWIPALGSLRGYSVGSFRRDLVAGLTVAAVAVPQAMAYAKIFGMPAEMGLYTAIVMTTVGALLDSSRQLINGPTNAISIAMLSALSVVPEEKRIAAAILMALLVGLIQTSISLFRFGDLSRFISQAVIVGFTLGASVLLLMDQMKNVLGLDAKIDPHDHFLVRFWTSVSMSHGIHWPTLWISAATIVVSISIRWVNQRFKLWLPEFLVALIFVSLSVAILDSQHSSGIKLSESVPQALPGMTVPAWDWNMVRELSSSAAAIAFLGLLEAMAMAKSIASKTGEKLDMNQQCLSEGLANTVGSLFGCFPGSGSLTRSYINHSSGAATQWSGVISAVGVASTVLLFAPLASYIPKAALAGILVLTALRMTEIATLRYIVKATRFDALILVVTALSAVLISVEFCILIGVVLSFAMYIPRAAKIALSELTVTADRVIREVHATDNRCPLIRIYNLEGELFFGCAPEFERLLEEIDSACDPSMRVVILRLKRARNPDSVCMQLLQQFIARMHERKIVVMLTGLNSEMTQVMANVGILNSVGAANVFREDSDIWASTIRAMQHAYELLGNERCSHCQHRFVSPNTADWSYMI